jgi:hypothetical protein
MSLKMLIKSIKSVTWVYGNVNIMYGFSVVVVTYDAREARIR